MKNTAYIAQSLDGFIAGPNGDLEWLQDFDNPENSDLGFAEFMNSIDALIMGRNTFETLLAFDCWPYNKPVYVASNTRKTIPEKLTGKAFLIQGSPGDLIKVLAQKTYHNLYIDGGVLIKSFLKEGLITELIITTMPVLLGGGIRLFGPLDNSIKLHLRNSEVLLNQMVKTTYEVSA